MNKLCYIDQTISDLLEVMSIKPGGFVFIVDKQKRLQGLITDGDIRRAFLSGVSVKDKIAKLNIKACTFAYTKTPYQEVVKKLNDKVRVIPIVDDNMLIKDYVLHDKRTHIPIAQPQLNGNEFNYVTDALLSSWISSSGEYINRFEVGFSNYIGSKFGVSTSNGTSALHLALMALDIKEEDEVIVPDLTFAATINAVLHANATPVIVDVEKESWCIDPNEIKQAITPKTKAIIVVHLYGQVCNMEEICNITKEYRLYLIEDCAEAHGAKYDNKKVGSFGDISCFSFFGNKIMTTGEGGMCLTNDSILDQKLRQLRDHGMSKEKKYWHDMIGYNYRMTNIQAAIGCAQLENIQNILELREKIESQYFQLFKEFSFIQPQKSIPQRKKVTWLVAALITSNNLDQLIKQFHNHDIDIRTFFYPLSSMPIYKPYSQNINRNSQNLSNTGILFPTHNNIDLTIIEQILKDFEGQNS